MACFKESTKSDWKDPTFWKKICDPLEIGSDQPIPNPNTDQIGAIDHKQARERLQKKGYALIDNPIFPQEKLDQIRDGIKKLHALGFPASFILLFDVTWDIAAISRELFQKPCLETNEFQFDILAWHITGEGFSPHRDRQPEDVPSSFQGDDARFVTSWIALSPATPQNSCLYVIPKEHDPGYMTGDTEEEDPLRRALTDKTRFQHIRALPRNPGQSLLFTHRIIHWGSARDPDADESVGPRIAISFVCSDPSYEKPYLSKKYFTNQQRPPFHIRLLLVCAQLLIYYQRFDLPKEALRICYEYCKEMEGELEDSYLRKVNLEFVKAMKEHSEDDEEHDGSPSDDEEAVLEAMLQAEEGGYGDDFVDDYDEDVGEDAEEENDESSDDELSPPESKKLKMGKS
mmetsp:Transcript_8340/g.16127  ORF Transcript_8340/g.16127 Transcript_8340/m.16127 type:complete len:401 (+) Transcript_8340:136-1338(+)|eukprot:scaffold3608_cov183-Amphora_coffeaeformis.AAC.20